MNRPLAASLAWLAVWIAVSTASSLYHMEPAEDLLARYEAEATARMIAEMEVSR